MKDYVFIGWSKNRDLAIKIKEYIDAQGFVGVIGGSYEGNPDSVRQRRGTVNETVNYQMSHCDQAILLFQKLDDNLSISGNLIYELGYISAQYNYIDYSTKLHIFKIDITQADDNLFPSDLHGVWGSMISSTGKSLDEMAREISNQFIRDQNQIREREKFQTLNDHHMVEFEIMKHFENPAMSDYDLAKDILVYQQAAFCYQEQADAKLKIERFISQMLEKREGSRELRWAANYAALTLDLFCCTIPNEANAAINMDRHVFREFLNRYKDIGEALADAFSNHFEEESLDKLIITDEFNQLNAFEALMIAQVQEHVTYLLLVYLSGETLTDEERVRYAKEGVKYGLSAIKNLKLISKRPEDEMYAKVLLSYAYKNLSSFYAILGDEEEQTAYANRSFRLRRTLSNHANGLPFVRPSLKDYIKLEYLLQVLEMARNSNDRDATIDYLQEIEEFLDARAKRDGIRDLLVNLLRNGYNEMKATL